MSTRIRFLGHAAIQIEVDGTSILIDPFLTGNPAAAVAADAVSADYILISHGHEDHVGDSIAIAQRTGATVVANFEIVSWLGAKHGLQKLQPLQHGGGIDLPFGRVKMTLAFHGSALPDGSNGGNPGGFYLRLNNGLRIYDACDTGLFGDMRLIGEEGVDVALVPIGDVFTMGPDDALRAVKLINPKHVIPIHYNTWPPIAQDVNAWADRVRQETSAQPVVLTPGQRFDA